MFDEAIQEYLNVLAIDPEHRKALLNLGNLYVQIGDDPKAIIAFERVLQLEPDNAEVWNDLGSLYEEAKLYEKAAAAFEQSISLDPLHEEAHFNLARLQCRGYYSNPDSSRKEKIIQRLHFILSVNPHHQKAKKLLEELGRTH